MGKKTGVLLVNLGTPDSFSVPDVRRYLKEFLMDPFVLDIPYLLRVFVVYCCILPSRPKYTAKAYESIWTEQGSPLRVISDELLAACQPRLEFPVALGMRYGTPSLEDGVRALLEQDPDLDEILLLPLYPHYAMSSTLTVIESFKRVLTKSFSGLSFRYIESFYGYSAYIRALSNSIMDDIKGQDVDHVLFSYHGIPERHLKKTDPTTQHCLQDRSCCQQASEAHRTCYKHHVMETTRLVAEACGFSESFYSVAFQSRLGKDPWLQPFTDQVLKELPKKGVQHLAVVCPAFVSDCLETLEEIGEEGRDLFCDNGGKSFRLIPCLNIRPDWVDAIVELVSDQSMHISGE